MKDCRGTAGGKDKPHVSMLSMTLSVHFNRSSTPLSVCQTLLVTEQILGN